MASAITHFIVGAAAALPAMSLRKPGWSVPLIGGLCAVAPDLDTYAMFAFDIPRGSALSHRGVFHSPCFWALVTFALAAVVGRTKAWVSLGLIWWLAATTHPLLDMLTDGGSGVMLLFPFSTERLFFPWRPIRVSPLGITRFFDRAGEILWSEMPFDAAAVALGLMVSRVKGSSG